MYQEPCVDVKITADGVGPRSMRGLHVLIDGVDVSRLVLRDHFAVHFATNNDGDNATYVVLALPVRKLEMDLPDTFLHAIALDADGEVA